MMPETHFTHSDVFQRLRHALEARGMTFHINPPREIVPAFLRGFQPDAMAVGPEGGVIIAVKSRKNSLPGQPLAEIARIVSGQKGWEFRLIYLNPSMDEMPLIAKPTPEQLQGTFSEIEVLMESGHSVVAFLIAWAALESLARLARGDGGTRNVSSLQAIQILAEEGYLENEAAGGLRDMVRLRNAVVHGDLSVDVPAGQVESLLEQLRTIEAEIMSVMSET